jgi:NAD(P)-dependent dehydrogenase (short-subunit alcohol dehydrogenase family)
MANELFDLTGEVAVVTGAGRGIGEGIAKVLAGAGASIVCAARRTEEIEAVAAAIVESGGKAIAVTTDVTDEAAIEALAEAAVAEFGKLNIWVNNAGGSPVNAPLIELPREEWDATIAVNLTSIFLGVRAAVKHMEKGGRIVNTSSMASDSVFEGSGHYSAAKAGVNMLTKTLAHELGPDIRVNAILPGFVPTEVLMEALSLKEEDLPGLLESLNLPAGRFGTPEDQGNAVLYFCSPAASWVTGQCLRVGGTSGA